MLTQPGMPLINLTWPGYIMIIHMAGFYFSYVSISGSPPGLVFPLWEVYSWLIPLSGESSPSFFLRGQAYDATRFWGLGGKAGVLQTSQNWCSPLEPSSLLQPLQVQTLKRITLLSSLQGLLCCQEPEGILISYGVCPETIACSVSICSEHLSLWLDPVCSVAPLSWQWSSNMSGTFHSFIDRLVQ